MLGTLAQIMDIALRAHIDRLLRKCEENDVPIEVVFTPEEIEEWGIKQAVEDDETFAAKGRFR